MTIGRNIGQYSGSPLAGLLRKLDKFGRKVDPVEGEDVEPVEDVEDQIEPVEAVEPDPEPEPAPTPSKVAGRSGGVDLDGLDPDQVDLVRKYADLLRRSTGRRTAKR